MRAIRIHQTGGPDQLRLETLPDPVPGAGEVLVRLEAIGINFIEIYQRTGVYPVTLPFTLGSEGAGTVVAVGAGATARVGDRVASEGLRGSYADLALAPAAKLVPLPDGVDAACGAAAMIQALTAHYLTHSTFPLQRGDWCLVHAAAGGTGLLLCQMARMRGARIIGTTSTAAKADLALAAGAEAVVLYTEQDVVEEVRRITGGAGVRVAYDSVGRSTWEASMASLAPRGMLVLFGQSSGVVPPIDPLLLSRMGSLYATRPTLTHYVSAPGELQARAREIFTWMGEGRLRLDISRRYPLEEAADAQRALESRGTSGKLLLVP
jgi:NADPH:quinone reductase